MMIAGEEPDRATSKLPRLHVERRTAMVARPNLSETPLDPTTLVELIEAQDLHEVEALL